MLTVAHLIDSFNAHYVIRVKTGQTSQATASWYKTALDKLQAVGQFPADSLRAHHLVAVEFSNHFVRALKALYKFAVEEELVPKDPFRKLATPPCGQRERTLTRAEMVRLYRAARPPFRRFVFVMAHTLGRPGEVRQLRWRDVRLADRCLVLTKFKAKDKRKDGVKVRTIPLDMVTGRMLQTWFDRRSPKPDDFVFTGRHGKAYTSNALRCAMRQVRKRAGLDGEGEGERVVCYTLRHTGATNATRLGIKDRVLADIMGHTTTRTTARYQHLDATDLVDAIDRAHAKRPRKPMTV